MVTHHPTSSPLGEVVSTQLHIFLGQANTNQKSALHPIPGSGLHKNFMKISKMSNTSTKLKH
jgi:hypothetical protein